MDAAFGASMSSGEYRVAGDGGHPRPRLQNPQAVETLRVNGSISNSPARL
jgi:hypothetical protein